MTTGIPTPDSTGIRTIAVVGPTASGKTALAVELARRLESEIISADSMQFYRGMDIGTAAPTVEERAAVRHHFVGFLDPDRQYSAGVFAKEATAVLDEITCRGRIGVVAGGSALYVAALLEGLFEGPARDPDIRNRLHRDADAAGVQALYARLRDVDPAYAAIVLPNDLRRIVRGLEVYEITGRPMSSLHDEHRRRTPPVPARYVGIDYSREALYARIDARVDAMLASGLIDEVQWLLESGYGPAIDRLKSLGYREIAAHLRGEQPLDEAIERMKMLTRRFAKRQLSWYRNDDRVRWLPIARFPSVSAQADAVMQRL